MIIGIDASRANRAQKTGVEWYAWHVIMALKERIPSHIRVRLYTDTPLRGALATLPAHWEECYLSWPPKRLWTQVRLSYEMLVRPPDVLFIPAHVFPLIHPKKTVMTVHDVAADAFPEAYNWFERWYSLSTARRAMHDMWRIIVPSSFTAGELMRVTHHAHDEHIHVVPHGYDKSYGIPVHWKERQRIQRKYGIEKEYLLYIGRLETKKNVRVLIHAFNKIRDARDVALVVIGKPGHGYARVHRAIKESPWESDIVQPGWVAQDDMPALMQGAQAFVFPSRYEGFGIPVLEAMAAGTPVIAATGSSLEEISGQAALLVSPDAPSKLAEAVLTVIGDASTAARMKKAGRAWVRHYSWSKCGRQTAELLCDGHLDAA